MIFVNKPKIIFYIIIINFIISLFITIKEFNYLFTIIDKFFKRVLFNLKKLYISLLIEIIAYLSFLYNIIKKCLILL